MEREKKNTDLVAINSELNLQLKDESVKAALLATTFKDLDFTNMKKAAMEGMIRGFQFRDFLEKNIYAIPFSGGYSLVTSIDYNRKIGMRSGVVGKSAPEYEEKDGKVIACSVTVKRKVNDYIGEYTAKVYFEEYDKGSNLWKTKPRTMIAKVAEMHALRMACPEELSQSYIEDEVGKENPSKGRLKEAMADKDGLTIGKITKKHGKETKQEIEAEGAGENQAPDAEGNEGGGEGEQTTLQID